MRRGWPYFCPFCIQKLETADIFSLVAPSRTPSGRFCPRGLGAVLWRLPTGLLVQCTEDVWSHIVKTADPSVRQGIKSLVVLVLWVLLLERKSSKFQGPADVSVKSVGRHQTIGHSMGAGGVKGLEILFWGAPLIQCCFPCLCF